MLGFCWKREFSILNSLGFGRNFLGKNDLILKILVVIVIFLLGLIFYKCVFNEVRILFIIFLFFSVFRDCVK